MSKESSTEFLIPLNVSGTEEPLHLAALTVEQLVLVAESDPSGEKKEIRGVLYSLVTRVSKPSIRAIRCRPCRVNTFQTSLCICIAIGFVTRVNAMHKMKKKILTYET